MRIVVPEGPWGQLIRDAAPDDIQLNLLTVPLPALHQALTHAVADGQAPDLAILDSVWIPEFAVDGFLYAFEDLDAEWMRGERMRDFLEPLVAANRYEGRTYGVSPLANVAGLWYRRAELGALGFEPPTTWTELRAVARAAAQNGIAHPIVMTGGSKGRRDHGLLPDPHSSPRTEAACSTRTE